MGIQVLIDLSGAVIAAIATAPMSTVVVSGFPPRGKIVFFLCTTDPGRNSRRMVS